MSVIGGKKVAASKNNLTKGFIISGIILGFVLPLLLSICRQYIPSSFYLSDNFIIRMLPSVVYYIYMISIFLYMGLFICSVIYTGFSTTAIIALPYIFFGLVQLLYTIAINYNNILLEAWPIVLAILGIVIISVLWYAFTKLISLIKMPNAAKIIISAVIVFLISDWMYIWDIINLLIENASVYMADVIDILFSRLVPFVICIVCAVFIYVILNDIINKKEKNNEGKKANA